jgi:hypothetical protein
VREIRGYGFGVERANRGKAYDGVVCMMMMIEALMDD